MDAEEPVPVVAPDALSTAQAVELIVHANEIKSLDANALSAAQAVELMVHASGAETLDVDTLTSHHFLDGLYIRRLDLPAGTVAVGKTHAQENLFVLLSGTMTVISMAGVSTVQGPFVVSTTPGEKRAVYAHTDAVMMNVHPNADNERDLDALESRYIIPESALDGLRELLPEDSLVALNKLLEQMDEEEKVEQ